MTPSKRLLRISFPLAMMAVCAFLWTNIAANSALLDNVPSAVGPGGWPRAMLVGLGLFAFLLLLSEMNEWRMDPQQAGGAATSDENEDAGSTAMALVGVAVILTYGFAIPYVGFPLATFLFLAVWCFLGRVRSLLTVSLICLVGTVVLLYMFVALAKMPLDRGMGPFNEWTISLYRVLRIY